MNRIMVVGNAGAGKSTFARRLGSKLALPVLCLAGAEDAVTPPDLVRSLAALLPSGSFDMIPGAGHLPCVEQPEIMAGRIGAFAKETAFV